MIISDRYKFAFIHIPKCAGTSIRTPLKQFDSCDGTFTGRVDIHPTLGQLDYVHIPLFVLREHFSSEFKVVQDYWSFAVMRDPFSRFASSVSQRMKIYSNQPIQKCSFDDIQGVIDDSIDYLACQPRDEHLLASEYIHFQKQVDYIQLDGTRIIDKIYLVDDIETLLTDLGEIVGQNLLEPTILGPQMTNANASVVYRNEVLRYVIESIRPVMNSVGKALSENAKQRIREWIYIPRDKRMRDLFAAEHVQAFIGDYYADDIRLFEQIRQRDRYVESS